MIDPSASRCRLRRGTRPVLLSIIVLIGLSNTTYAAQEWLLCKAFMKDGSLAQQVIYMYDDQKPGLYWYTQVGERLDFEPGWEITRDMFKLFESGSINRRNGEYKQTGMLGGVTYGKCERIEPRPVSGGIHGGPPR